MYKATVIIKRREVILDPQGKAVEQGAKLLGFNNITQVRIDKLAEFKIDVADKTEAKNEVTEFCNKLLINPNLEDFQFTLEEINEI